MWRIKWLYEGGNSFVYEKFLFDPWHVTCLIQIEMLNVNRCWLGARHEGLKWGWALARTNAKIVFMQILSENLELAEYEYRATLNNKTFGGPTATTATTQHMETHENTFVKPMNAFSHHDSSPGKPERYKWGRTFFYQSPGVMIYARVPTCLVMLRVIGPGDGDVMTSVEISNVCQIQFYLHPTSTATHSAAHFPMEGSCCYLLPSNYQHLVETFEKSRNN